MRAQISGVSKTTSNMNSEIINVDDVPPSHKDRRKMMHHRGSKALHEIKGAENFGTMDAFDWFENPTQ